MDRKERNKKYRILNSDRIKAQQKIYRDNNREIIKKRRGNTDPEKKKRWNKKYKLRYPDKYRESQRLAKARHSKELTDGYVAKQLRKRKITPTPDLIEEKRLTLKLKRKIHEITTELNKR